MFFSFYISESREYFLIIINSILGNTFSVVPAFF